MITLGVFNYILQILIISGLDSLFPRRSNESSIFQNTIHSHSHVQHTVEVPTSRSLLRLRIFSHLPKSLASHEVGISIKGPSTRHFISHVTTLSCIFLPYKFDAASKRGLSAETYTLFPLPFSTHLRGACMMTL